MPLPEARTDSEQFAQLQDWLDSYSPAELFDVSNTSSVIRPEVTAILPKDSNKRLGQLKLAYDNYQKLDCPDWNEFSSKKDDEQSPMKQVGKYLTAVVERNVSGASPTQSQPLLRDD